MLWTKCKTSYGGLGDEIKMEVKVYRSQCKREKAHLTVILTADNIQDQRTTG